MRLAEFITKHRERLFERWEEYARERLDRDLDKSELLDHLPEFVDDLVQALRSQAEDSPEIESARGHGRQRMRVGVDIGSLSREMILVGETIAELATEQGENFSSSELLRMMSTIGRSVAASVTAYAEARDRQLAEQTAQHFSFMAHEIRSPLHNARLAAELLARAPKRERPDYAKRLDRALTRLDDLVDDSLIEARLYDEPRLNVERLRALELVEHAHDDLAGQLAEKNLLLEHEVEDFTLDGDRTLLGSALTNLMRNALKFTPDGGRVTVAAHHTDGRAVFRVQDECGGIPEAFVPRLFEPFAQARPAKGGSGLGLLIVKQAVEAHGGSVEVENQPGRGCCFTVDLPRHR